MSLPGFDHLLKHVPDLRTPAGRLQFFALPVALFAFVTGLYISEDRSWPFWWLDGEIVIGTLGFSLMAMFFRAKRRYQDAYGDLAYSAAARRFLFPGLFLVFAVVARIAYIPGPEIPAFIRQPLFPVVGCLLLVAGSVLWLRSIEVFGVDNLTMLYVYFPEESRLVRHEIYEILRHPIYAAALRIALGLAFLNGTWLAVTCGVVFALGLWGWLRLVEERELLDRFGEAYAEYRGRVPAFWPRLSQIPAFFQFLIAGERPR